MSVLKTRKLIRIEPVSPGSPPDIDSDFSKKYRERAVEYVTQKYGQDNVSNIVTFGTLKAKGAFKSLCTIYSVPFVEANKVTNLIPGTKNGEEFNLSQTFDPEYERYEEAEAFREALEDPAWREIFDKSLELENRNRQTGIHAAGVIISKEKLENVIPTQMVKVKRDEENAAEFADGEKYSWKPVSQWVYKELEAIGLIKMDFLGLETIDIIQRAVEYAMQNNKDIISMVDLIHGPMDDPKVYKLFQQGHTLGIFQFGSSMVMDLLRKMLPDSFNDLAATTAIARPGPMGMDSHNKYANRKNGLEDVDYIHPDFEGGPLEKILGSTYGLLVYQEQVMQISAEIAGMTLQQGDDLRSAMGKKKIEEMKALKPIFFEGAQKNGYSVEAVTVLWDTIAEMAKYGFNKAHSVSYAMNAYQSAYLKTYYPVEFISSLITQATYNNNKRGSIHEILKECERLGIKVKTADVNLSNLDVAPDFLQGGENIVFGLASLRDVSEHNARIIIKEREENGLFSSLNDFVSRCYKAGLKVTKVYESIALAGGFDSISPSRKGAVESIPLMIDAAKKSSTSGDSLFDTIEELSGTDDIVVSEEEFSFADKLKYEADIIGLYLTGHPLENIPMSQRNETIASLLQKNKKGEYLIMAAVNHIDSKVFNNGKRITLTLDDGTGKTIDARLSKPAIATMDKHEARQKLISMYKDGLRSIPDNIKSKVCDQSVIPREPIETNRPYLFKVSYKRGWNDVPIVNVEWFIPLRLSHNGELPVRMRCEVTKDNVEKMKKIYSGLPKKISEVIPGDVSIFRATHRGLDRVPISTGDEEFFQAIEDMAQEKNTLGELTTEELKNTKKRTKRSWPPKVISDGIKSDVKEGQVFFEDTIEAIENLDYKDSGYSTEKTQRVEMGIEKYLGYNSYDFGISKASLKEE